MQRFCQQCSRFHPLQLFDEGKRSCRRRLDGHNRRRRKTQPDTAAARAYFLAEEGSGGRSAGVLSLLNILSRLQENSSERTNGLINEQDLLLEYIKKAITTSASADSHCTTPTTGIMYNANTHHEAPSMEQRSDPQPSCGPIGAHTPGPAASQVFSSSADPHVLLSSSPGIERLALLLHGYLKGQVPTVPKLVQEALLSHLLQNQPRSHGPAEASAVEKNSAAMERMMDLPQVGNIPSSSSPYLGTTSDSRQLSQRLLELGQMVHHSIGSHAVHQSLPEKFPQQCLPDLEKIYALRGVSDSRGMETISGKEDLTMTKSSAATALDSNADLTRKPSFSCTAAEDRRNSHYATCNQPFATSDVPPKSHSLRVTAQTQSRSEHPQGSPYANIQDRTGRISFKLFDRNPRDFPQLLRTQILEWLAQVPSEMESYIRPGCVILTIYLSMSVKMWEELCQNLHSSLKRLLNISNSDFWCTGRILVQAEHELAYIVDGEVHKLGPVRPTTAKILSVRPLAAVAGQPTKLILRGCNFTAPGLRILGAYQGKYASQGSAWVKEEGQGFDKTNSKTVMIEAGNAYEEKYVSFIGGPCNAIGRCFIEVEDEGVGGGFVPLIVADDKVCSELHTLEDEIQRVSSGAIAMAMENGISPEEVSNFVNAARSAIETEATYFLHDLGWVFQKAFWKTNELVGEKHAGFQLPAATMKRLLKYAVEHDWCAVIHRLLDILFSVNVEPAYLTFMDALVIIEEVNLLHIAVRRICRPMVDLLLAYEPCTQPETPRDCSSTDGETVLYTQRSRKFVFTPDMVGPARLTPLHVAASMKEAESVIDALTSDPLKIGLHAWNHAQDAAGKTPFSCALAQGNISYIQMVWKKLAQRRILGQVTIDILSDSSSAVQQEDLSRPEESNFVDGAVNQCTSTHLGNYGDSGSHESSMEHTRWGVLHLEKPCGDAAPSSQKRCIQQAKKSLGYLGGVKGRMFKPFLLSMVAIASVCVCVCVLLMGPPEVNLVSTFTWDSVRFGPQ
ncbi:hypothetical protein O6H91_16G042900 [Diphasiastrum complanatum]|nr:hypothetical protein O6H91_16G042900 [Diphasiastrum complanatum]